MNAKKRRPMHSLLALIAALTLALSAGPALAAKGGGGGKPPSDTTPPDPITDLAPDWVTHKHVRYTWTATGDDGSEGGPAASYDCRVTTGAFGGPGEPAFPWDAAWPCWGPVAPAEPGTVQMDNEGFFLPATQYSLAMKVIDDAGNASELSNVLTFTTDPTAWTVELVDSPVWRGYPLNVHVAVDPRGEPAIAWERDGIVSFTWQSAGGWETEEVCSYGGWGYGPSLAFDPADGKPTMATRCTDGIFFAKREPSGWTLERVTVWSGPASPELAYSPVTGEPAIATYDRPGRNGQREGRTAGLKYSYRTGSTWTTEHVDDLHVDAYGVDISLAFTETGEAAIACQADADDSDDRDAISNRTDSLRYYERGASGWSAAEVVEGPEGPGGNVGEGCDLAFDPLTGEACVVYKSMPPRRLAFARRVGTTWVPEIIDDSGPNDASIGLAFDAAGTAHVIYQPVDTGYGEALVATLPAGGTWSSESACGGPSYGKSVAIDPTTDGPVVGIGVWYGPAFGRR